MASIHGVRDTIPQRGKERFTGARRFCNIGRILASVGIVFVLLVVFQGSGSAEANSGTYGWELGAQFDGETAGFQGNDSGVDVVCPDGYLVVGGGIGWG